MMTDDSTSLTVSAHEAVFDSYPTLENFLEADPQDELDLALNQVHGLFLKDFTKLDFLHSSAEQHTYTFKAKSAEGKTYALKTLLLPSSVPPAEEEKEIGKFLMEIDLTEMMNKFLRNEGVVKVVASGKKEIYFQSQQGFISREIPYFVTDYCAGGDLEQLNEPHFSFQKKIDIFAQIAQALSFLHRYYHIVHRDLKPSNIMLTESGHPLIIDFGSFEIIGRKSRKYETGTKPYFSPAQAQSMLLLQEYNQKGGLLLLPEHTYRTDLYSFTLVMADILFNGCDNNPVKKIRDYYKGDTEYYQYIASDPVITFPPTGFGSLDMILYRGISGKTRERFSSMQEMADSLSALSKDLS